MLVPGGPDEALQVIDARDLALWMVEKTEARTGGSFNTIGPRHPLTWSGMIETATLVLGAHVEPTWVGDTFIEEQKAAERSQLPLYISRDNPRFRYMFRVSGKRAFENGLKLRPLSETITDTLLWLRGPHAADAKTVGLSRELEARLLAIWRTRVD
jgi:2'-hydroxyisoflavone reductase